MHIFRRAGSPALLCAVTALGPGILSCAQSKEPAKSSQDSLEGEEDDADTLGSIPNYLRSLYAKAGRFDDVELRLAKGRCRARLEPRFHSPALIYGAPQTTEELISDIIDA